MAAIRMTSRLISAYAEAEPWKIDHDFAMVCRDLEDNMAWGTRLIQVLAEEEASFQTEFIAEFQANHAEARVSECETAIAKLDAVRRELVEVLQKVLSTVEGLQQKGHQLEGVEEFRQQLDGAQCVMEAAEFEKELPSLDSMLPLVRPDNPRPNRYGD